LIKIIVYLECFNHCGFIWRGVVTHKFGTGLVNHGIEPLGELLNPLDQFLIHWEGDPHLLFALKIANFLHFFLTGAPCTLARWAYPHWCTLYIRKVSQWRSFPIDNLRQFLKNVFFEKTLEILLDGMRCLEPLLPKWI